MFFIRDIIFYRAYYLLLAILSFTRYVISHRTYHLLPDIFIYIRHVILLNILWLKHLIIYKASYSTMHVMICCVSYYLSSMSFYWIYYNLCILLNTKHIILLSILSFVHLIIYWVCYITKHIISYAYHYLFDILLLLYLIIWLAHYLVNMSLNWICHLTKHNLICISYYYLRILFYQDSKIFLNKI